MPVIALPVITVCAIIFAIAFNLSIWFGLLLVIWLIASITWFLKTLHHDPGKWYDWFIGVPVLFIAYVWLLADKVANRNEKNKN